MMTGTLLRDARLNPQGKEDAGGRLHLRGEQVSVHPEHAGLVRRGSKRKRRPRRSATQTKPATAPVTKSTGPATGAE